LVREIERVKC